MRRYDLFIIEYGFFFCVDLYLVYSEFLCFKLRVMIVLDFYWVEFEVKEIG